MSLSGVAELPLHDGHVPAWMARYMKRLLRAIVAVIVEEYGPGELVRRLANPLWFQALNNAIGMDWDSSGSTTVLIGLLRQVADENPELGIVVAGGKGALARRVPEELEKRAERLGRARLEELVEASRLSAKTDTCLLQDGYTLYHHAIVVAETGEWTVVQQGMNTEARLARRYHLQGPRSGDLTLEPHTGIATARREEAVLDLTSRTSLEARKTILDLARQSPRKTLREVYEAQRLLLGVPPITVWTGQTARLRLEPKALLFYRPQPKPPRHIGEALRRIYEANPRSIRELVLVEGVGPAVLRSLALVAELVYGATASHEDPADTPIDPFRYAYVVGGKDGVPFPFNPRLAREVIEFLEDAIQKARLGDREKLRALRRLRSLLPRASTP